MFFSIFFLNLCNYSEKNDNRLSLNSKNDNIKKIIIKDSLVCSYLLVDPYLKKIDQFREGIPYYKYLEYIGDSYYINEDYHKSFMTYSRSLIQLSKNAHNYLDNLSRITQKQSIILQYLNNEKGHIRKIEQVSWALKRKYYKTNNNLSFTNNLTNKNNLKDSSNDPFKAWYMNTRLDQDSIIDTNYYRFYSLGMSKYSKGNYREALSYFCNAKEFINKNDIKAYDLSLNLEMIIGACQDLLGEYQDALNTHSKSLKLYKNTGNKSKKIYQNIIENIGLEFFRISKYDSAYHYHLTSLFNKLLFNKHNELALAFSYENIGYYYLIQDQLDISLDYFKIALKIRGENNSTKTSLYYQNLNLIGTIYYLLGDYEMSLSYYMSALQKNEYELSIPDKKFNQMYTFLLMGNVYKKLNEVNYALKYYNKSLKIAEEIDNDTYKIMNIINIAIVYSKLNKYKLTVSNLQLAVKMKQQLKNIEIINLYQIYQQIAYLYYYLDDFNNSISYLNKSIDLFSSKKNSLKLFTYNNYHLFAKIMIKSNQTDSALVYFQKALISLTHNFDNPDINVNPSPTFLPSDIDLIETLHLKANTLYDYYQEDKTKKQYLITAYNTFNLAIDLLDKLKTKFRSESSKIFIAEQYDKTVLKAIEVSYTLYKQSQNKDYLKNIFHIVEKSKAAALRHAILDSEAKYNADIPDSLITEEKALLGKWNHYHTLLNQNKSRSQKLTSPEISYYKSQVFELGQKYDFLVDYFENLYPKYYNLKYHKSTVTVSQIQKKLPESSVMIEYHFIDNNLYIFCISNNELELHTVAVDDEFADLVNDFRIGVRDINDDKYMSTAHRLYKRIFNPIKHFVQDKHIIIIPSGKLGYIPFEALLTKPAVLKYRDYRNLPYLIRDNNISYDYSATLYFLDIHIDTTGKTKNFSGFAPVNYD